MKIHKIKHDINFVPFSKDQKYRISKKLGIPAKWVSKFSWDKRQDIEKIIGLLNNGDSTKLQDSRNNVIMEIISCIKLGEIEFDTTIFHKIPHDTQKILYLEIMKELPKKTEEKNDGQTKLDEFREEWISDSEKSLKHMLQLFSSDLIVIEEFELLFKGQAGQ